MVLPILQRLLRPYDIVEALRGPCSLSSPRSVGVSEAEKGKFWASRMPQYLVDVLPTPPSWSADGLFLHTQADCPRGVRWTLKNKCSQ